LQAWTDPKKIKQWWGPNNVTIPECKIDLRLGGKFYVVMEAAKPWAIQRDKVADGGKITVVEPNPKLFYTAQAWTDGAKETTTIDQTTELTLEKEQG